jgi:hypothetical protein
MASRSETGHNKNVANFGTAYQILEEMGTLYNPSNQNIILSKLLPIRTELKAVTKGLNDKLPLYKNNVAAREIAIEPLKKLMTRVINNVKSLDISEANKENIINLAIKIRGYKTKKAPKLDTDAKTTESEDDSVSTSQMSYDNRIANLDTLIAQLVSTTKYAPNETDLKIVTLKALHASLEAASTAVNASSAAIITAKKSRNKILYLNKINVIQLIKEIKSYLLGIGDEAKPYYKAIVKLKFTDLKK